MELFVTKSHTLKKYHYPLHECPPNALQQLDCGHAFDHRFILGSEQCGTEVLGSGMAAILGGQQPDLVGGGYSGPAAASY